MKRLLPLAFIIAVLGMPLTGHARGGADTPRTVYFSAVDAKGAPVTDLTAGDLAVKEGGKDRAIAQVAHASEPILVSILVDDGGTGAFQGPVAELINSLQDKGQFAIRAFNPQPSKLTDFTADFNTLKTALDGIGARGNIATTGEQMVDAVSAAASELQKRKAPRSAILVLTVGGEKAQNQRAEPTLNTLRDSGASLSVVHLAGLELGQVLGDGPKRSGGVIQQIAGGVAPTGILAKIAANLQQQYVLTYTLPDGVKPSDRLSLTTSRKGVTLVAPQRVPDK
jgi:hypothetical protein